MAQEHRDKNWKLEKKLLISWDRSLILVGGTRSISVTSSVDVAKWWYLLRWHCNKRRPTKTKWKSQLKSWNQLVLLILFYIALLHTIDLKNHVIDWDSTGYCNTSCFQRLSEESWLNYNNPGRTLSPITNWFHKQTYSYTHRSHCIFENFQSLIIFFFILKQLSALLEKF